MPALFRIWTLVGGRLSQALAGIRSIETYDTGINDVFPAIAARSLEALTAS
jgi:hypothetical protein